MPRAPRNHVAGGLFHVTSRGNRRCDIYLAPSDRVLFLSLLSRAIGGAEWQCLAYCLMTNHFHLVLAMAKPTLSVGMHWLNTCYAMRFNKLHGVNGHLFEDRFHAEAIETESHLLEACRYVPLNPVRAGLCDHPADWRWSSYRAVVGIEPPTVTSVDAALALFGRTAESARSLYEAFVEDGRRRVLEKRAFDRHGPGTVPGTWLDQPKPYTPA